MKRALVSLLFLGAAGLAAAQEPVHFNHAGILIPGAIGRMQLERGGPLPGYFQPVEIRAPDGAQVSYAVNDRFDATQNVPAKSAMLVGLVYRLRVTGIPKHEGEELYPTIEIINRLYPPVGEEMKFPVPIQLTQEDLDSALSGRFITRIVYVENPRQAYPRSEDPKSQECFEVSPKNDPLATADRLGRPIAIVRIGGRTPDTTAEPGSEFMYCSPPLLLPRAVVAELEAKKRPPAIKAEKQNVRQAEFTLLDQPQP
jgi:hypothetical protein